MNGDGAKPQLKYRLVYEFLLGAIRSGDLKPDQKLPSDAELCVQFQASRMTVIRAVNDLQTKGFVRRRPGSGTFVRVPEQTESHTFGLLIPDLGECEIFEPVCRGMTQAGESAGQALLWGNTTPGSADQEKMAQELCQFYTSRKVSGVFFAPLEFTPHKDAVNRQVCGEFDRAGIPVILLDRCILPFPGRSRYDLVGIDNRRAGYRMTEHLLKLGCRRIGFLAKPLSAPTVDARIAGYRDAHFNWRTGYREELVKWCEPDDSAQVHEFLETERPEAIVCGNDLTAGRLMHTLMGLGVRIPSDVRIVGIDDVKYAHLLPVPLTTLRQPCTQIGAAAISAMLERIAKPEMVARDILLDCELVVRGSCGAPLD